MVAQWHKTHGQGLRHPLLGLGSFAWGGERLRVSRLTVPSQYLGRELLIRAIEPGRFHVAFPNGWETDGNVGQPVTTPDSAFELTIDEIEANPGCRFKVSRSSATATALSLLDSVSVAERGRGTGVLVLTVRGGDPEQTAAIANAVANVYLRQNVENRSEEAQNSLAFIEKQLPQLKSETDAAESALEKFQARSGGMDVSARG